MNTINEQIRPDILTNQGRYFDFLQRNNTITVEEVAHALSNICRFGGHTRSFYSVAQHSVMVSLIVPAEDALWGLFHDAAEAYIGDICRPLKNLLPDYLKIESDVESEVLAKLGLTGLKPKSVKEADLIMLATEQRDLMPQHDDEWALIAGISPLPIKISPMSPDMACGFFMHRYQEIMTVAEVKA